MRSFVVVKVLIQNQEGKILLLRRSATNERRPLQWDFVGGWLDGGEDIVACLRREAREEAGVELGSPELVFTAQKPTDEHGVGNWLYFVDRLPREQSVKLSNEHDKYEWVNKEELLNKIEYPLQRDFIEHVKRYDLWK